MAWKRLIFLFFFLTSFVEAKDFNLHKIISLDEPWGSTFINDNELLITEKSGKIKLLNIFTTCFFKIEVFTLTFSTPWNSFINNFS